MVVRPGSDPVEHVRSTHESVRAGGDRLRALINQTTLGLDAILGYQFPITDTTATMYEQIHNDLDITARITALETERGVETPTATGLYLQIQTLHADQATQQGIRRTHAATINAYERPSYRGAPRPSYTDYTDAQAEVARADAQLARIDADIRAAQQRIVSIQQELRGLEHFSMPGGLYAGAATSRHAEFAHIQTNARDHELYHITNTIPHNSYQAGATGIAALDLDPLFVTGVTTAPTAGSYRYSIITQHNNAITSGARREVVVYDDAGRQHTVQLSGIRINGTNLECDNIQIEGSATDITYPLRVHDLSIRCTRQDGSGRSFYHDKPLSLTITAAAQMTPADRRSHFAAVETNMTRNVIQGRLFRNYHDHYDRIERTAFEAILAENDLYSKNVTEQREKDELMENIRGSSTRTGGVALHPVVADPGLTGGTMYDNFVNWLVDECEAPAEALRSEDAYRAWIRNRLETHTQAYLQARVDVFAQRAEVRTTINSALYAYISQLDAERQNADGRPRSAMDFEAQIGRTAALMPHQQRNYLEFLSNQSQKIDGSVRPYQYNPHTGREEQGGNPINYSLDLTMGTPSPINAKLTIGQDEIPLKSPGNHVALMRHVLSNPAITDQNVRYHVCLSIMKAMVMMANKQGVLVRGYDASGNDIEVTIVNDKLQMRHGVFDPGTRTKTRRTLFDETRFDKTQEVTSGPAFARGASSLRSGILGVAEYFNRSMDNYYQDLIDARRTRRRTSLMQHPKRGRQFGASYRNLSFDDQTITVGEHSITVGCVRGIFRMTLPGREEPVTDANLGRLLNRPELRGAELAIIRAVNQGLLTMYRNKPAIASRNYGVRDERNGRVYIIDEQGDIGMVEHDASVRFARQRWRNRRTPYGRVTVMPLGMRLLNETEKNSFLQNPYLVGLMTRAMNRDF